MKHILVTGGGGFVGSKLIERLSEIGGYNIRASVRQSIQRSNCSCKDTVVADLSPETDWTYPLEGIDCVVHTAALAHVFGKSASHSSDDFKRINVNGTLNLAKQAAEKNVRQFIFISTIGVNGMVTGLKPFSEKSVPAPHSKYAESKLEAESGLREIAEGSGMQLVVIRPPLVYSWDAPGNFGRLLRIVEAGLPIPFALVKNKRSLIAVENLVDFITKVIGMKGAQIELFLISDGYDISTPELLQYLSVGSKCRLRLIPVPVFFLKILFKVLGKENMYDQLCSSLQVDISKASRSLGWEPKLHTREALTAAARKYAGARRPLKQAG